MASLPPIPSEVFAERVLANKANAAATAARARFEKRCEACEKTFYSEGAYENHLGSQKHRILAARWRGAGTETESVVDSTFSLGEPMEAHSTTTESTVNGGHEGAMDDEGEEEFENVVEGLRKTKIDPQDPVSARPGRPTPSAAAQMETEHPLSPEKTQDEDEEDYKTDIKLCLFCNYASPTTDLNVHHMGKQHGFFIPEKDYLVDLEGFVNYLAETIQVLHACLFCHKVLHSAHGVQTHMRDRGHCMLAYTTEDEQLDVGEFYDFRSTYSDDEEDDEDEVNGGVSLGTKRAVKTTVQHEDGEDVEMDGDDEGWESDSTLSSVPTDEITSVPIENRDHQFAKLDLHKHHSHTDPRPHKNSDGYHSHAHHTPTAVYHDEYELHLPSGRTAGHRSLRMYYRQNLRNYPTPEEREQQRLIAASAEAGRHISDDEDDASQATETNGRGRQMVSRANGGLGMTGVSDAKKREVRVVEQREQKRAMRQQLKYSAKVQRQQNSQKHFRDPLLQ